MEEKTPSQGGDQKKRGEWPETGKRGGQGEGDVGKKGGDLGGGQGGQGQPQQKPREGGNTEDVER
jgi:hypothetical protein